MDVDAGATVGPLGHHPRDQGHAQHVKLMGQAVDGDRLQAGIAEDHFVERFAGRVAGIGGLNVHGQHPPQVRKLLQKRHRPLQAHRLEIGPLLRIADEQSLPASWHSARAICMVRVLCSLSIRSPT